MCCSAWGRKESDTTERLNWTELSSREGTEMVYLRVVRWANKWNLRCKELTHWKRPRCWEKLRAGREEDDRGWDGWMASPTQWIWVWVDSRSWWWTGRPGVLQFMGLQRVGHDWVTELNWTGLNWSGHFQTPMQSFTVVLNNLISVKFLK